MSNIPSNIASRRIGFYVIAAIGRNNIDTWRHDIGLHTLVVSRTDRRMSVAYPTRSHIVSTRGSLIVDDACTISRSSHTYCCWRTAWRMDAISHLTSIQRSVCTAYRNITSSFEQLDVCFVANQFDGDFPF